MSPVWRDGEWWIGQVAVGWVGAALDDDVRIPARLSVPPTGGGMVEPTDFEIEFVVHVVAHEIARGEGSEQLMVCDVCCGDDMPPAALAEQPEGVSLVAFCPGPSWFWDSENRPSDLAAKFARR